eukprot:gene9977-12229_t
MQNNQQQQQEESSIPFNSSIPSSQKIWRPIWVPDHQENRCLNCNTQFNTLLRRHHCRGCGNLFCNNCSNKRQSLPQLHYNKPVRICNRCDDLANFSKLALSNEIKDRIDSSKGFSNLTLDLLLNLTKNTITRDQVMRASILQALIAMAICDDVSLQIAASEAISILATNSKYQRKIVECGGLAPLILLINSPTEKVLQYTTSALSSLAENVENQTTIVQVGGINPLKNVLLYQGNTQIPINSATTLYHLSSNKSNSSQLTQPDLIEILIKIII